MTRARIQLLKALHVRIQEAMQMNPFDDVLVIPSALAADMAEHETRLEFALDYLKRVAESLVAEAGAGDAEVIYSHLAVLLGCSLHTLGLAEPAMRAAAEIIRAETDSANQALEGTDSTHSLYGDGRKQKRILPGDN